MPFYCYKCPACDATTRDLRSMSESEDPLACECGAAMHRDFPAECGKRPPTHYYADPIEMYSVALNDTQEIADFQQRCPGVECSADPRNPLFGVPVARTREQKKRILRTEGYEEGN